MKSLFRKQSIQEAGTEILSIVIGVLLALGVSEWNEDRVHQQRARQAIANIANELRSNIKLMEIIHANNVAIVNSANELDRPDDKGESRFIPGLQIQDTAWKTLISTGVSAHIDYEVLYSISEIYSIQQIYRSFGYQLVNTMMSTSALSLAINPESKTNSGNIFLEDNMALIVGIETTLMTSYENGLRKLVATADNSND